MEECRGESTSYAVCEGYFYQCHCINNWFTYNNNNSVNQLSYAMVYIKVPFAFDVFYFLFIPLHKTTGLLNWSTKYTLSLQILYTYLDKKDILQYVIYILTVRDITEEAV